MNVYMIPMTETESKGFVYYLGMETARKIVIEYVPDGSEVLTKKTIGIYFPDSGTYRTVRRFSVHWFKKDNGWGFDAPVLSKLQEENLKTVVVYDSEQELLYTINEKDLLSSINNRKYGNHGHQIMIPKEFWTIANTDGSPLKEV